MFDGPKGTTLASVTDGASGTILLVQAAEPVVWTQPGDLAVAAGADLPRFDGNMWRMAMVNGAVMDISPGPADQLGAMITRNGSEVYSAPPKMVGPQAEIRAARPNPPEPIVRLLPNAPPRTARPLPDPTPGVADQSPSMTDQRLSDLEIRLKRVEEKLDRLIEKLDPPGAAVKN